MKRILPFLLPVVLLLPGVAMAQGLPALERRGRRGAVRGLLPGLPPGLGAAFSTWQPG